MSSQLFSRFAPNVQRALNQDIPHIVANKVLSAFKKNFREEGFFGKRWKDVKRRTNPTKSQANKASASRAILTGSTGNLGRSLQVKEENGLRVVIESDLPYSAAHNEGTNSAGRKRNTRIPQRQFMGDHPEVRRIVKETIQKELKKAFEK
jgi:phage gpG-like protein